MDELFVEACKYLDEYPPLPRSLFASDREYNNYVDWTLDQYTKAKRLEQFDSTGYAYFAGEEW